jgi:hypothetical protein
MARRPVRIADTVMSSDSLPPGPPGSPGPPDTGAPLIRGWGTDLRNLVILLLAGCLIFGVIQQCTRSSPSTEIPATIGLPATTTGLPATTTGLPRHWRIWPDDPDNSKPRLVTEEDALKHLEIKIEAVNREPADINAHIGDPFLINAEISITLKQEELSFAVPISGHSVEENLQIVRVRATLEGSSFTVLAIGPSENSVSEPTKLIWEVTPNVEGKDKVLLLSFQKIYTLDGREQEGPSSECETRVNVDPAQSGRDWIRERLSWIGEKFFPSGAAHEVEPCPSDKDEESKLQMALAQCKVDWMNHPSAREDKSSGAPSSSDYLAACMESHGYRHRVACLATADSESCYEPIHPGERYKALAGGRYKALAQCKVDWMKNPAAREDKSSGALSSSDYLVACMESHGYRRRIACLATADSESCYDPIHIGGRYKALAQCKVDWMNNAAAREDKSSDALSSGDYLAACMESHGYRRRVACLATADSESCYDLTNSATPLEDTPPFDAPRGRTAGAAIEINVNAHSAEQKATREIHDPLAVPW